MRRLFSLAFLAAAATSLHAQSPVRTADPAVRGVPLSAFPRFVKLSDKVYGYEEIRQPGFTTVSLIVIGRNGVLVADGQGSVQATQTMLDKITTISPLPVKWYVVGSDHGDHTAGNSVLPKDIRFVVHANSLAQLKKDSAAAATANRPAVIVPPTSMTSDTETIDLGGISVRVRFLGRAHTGGDLMVEVPSEKLLFMSEAYLNRVFPAMRSAYGAEWVRTIDSALALKNVERFIPGHGFIEEAKVSREELVTFREALVAVMAEVKRLKAAGLTVDQAIAQVNWGPYAKWFLAEQQSPIAIRRLWTELDGALK
jgi:cyclase